MSNRHRSQINPDGDIAIYFYLRKLGFLKIYVISCYENVKFLLKW